MLSPSLREAGCAAGSHSKEHNSERIFVVFVFMLVSVFVVVTKNFLSSVFLTAPAQHSFFSLYFLQYLDV